MTVWLSRWRAFLVRVCDHDIVNAMPTASLEWVTLFSMTPLRTLRCPVNVGAVLLRDGAGELGFSKVVRRSFRGFTGRPRLPAVVSKHASERGAWEEAAELYFTDSSSALAVSSEDSATSSTKAGPSQSWKQALGRIKAGERVHDSQDSGFKSRRGEADWSRSSDDKGRREKGSVPRGKKAPSGVAATYDNEAFAAREWGEVGSGTREGGQVMSDVPSNERGSLGRARSPKEEFRQPRTSPGWSWREEESVSKRGHRLWKSGGNFDADEEEDTEDEEIDDYERSSPRRRGGSVDYSEHNNSKVPKVVGEVLYGVSPIKAALQACRRKFHVLYVQVGLEEKLATGKKKDKAAVVFVLNTAKSLRVSTVVTSKHNLNLLAENRPHQGLILDASPLELVLTEELEYPEERKGARPAVWVALDEIMDPQNFGAILRSAFFLGAEGIVVCAKNSAPLSGIVSKASSGALEAMEVRYCKNMVKFLDRCVQNGWQVVGATTEPGAVSVWDLAPAMPTILVLGNEGKGLRTNVRRACTKTVSISGALEMSSTSGSRGYLVTGTRDVEQGTKKPEVEILLRSGAVESLNVSVAAGILLHQLLTRPIDDLPEGSSLED